MQQKFLHNVKLIALAEAAIALVGMFLAWTVEKLPAQLLNQQQGQFGQGDQGQFGQLANAMTTTTQNGFNSWGWLALVGILVVVVATLVTGPPQRDYDRNGRIIATIGFGVIALAALIYFFRLTSVAKDYEQAMLQRGIQYSASAGMGLWSVMLAGILGALWVSGVLAKLNTNRPAAQGYAGQYPPQQYPGQPYPGQPQQPYPPQYPQQAPYPPQQAGGYPPQQHYPPQYPQQPPYPNQQQGAHPQQEGYPPQQQGYPNQTAGYPPQQQGYPNQAPPHYPPQQTHGQGQPVQHPPAQQPPHPDAPPPPPPPPSNPYV